MLSILILFFRRILHFCFLGGSRLSLLVWLLNSFRVRHKLHSNNQVKMNKVHLPSESSDFSAVTYWHVVGPSVDLDSEATT